MINDSLHTAGRFVPCGSELLLQPDEADPFLIGRVVSYACEFLQEPDQARYLQSTFSIGIVTRAIERRVHHRKGMILFFLSLFSGGRRKGSILWISKIVFLMRFSSSFT